MAKRRKSRKLGSARYRQLGANEDIKANIGNILFVVVAVAVGIFAITRPVRKD